MPVPLPGPRLPHDMAFTDNYSILNDLPAVLGRGTAEAELHAVRDAPGPAVALRGHPALRRQPRTSAGSRPTPTYILHWLNAYEDGDEIVLDGYFQEKPMPRPLADAPDGYQHMMAYLDEHSFSPKLHRWRFNLKTGETARTATGRARSLSSACSTTAMPASRIATPIAPRTKPGWFLFNGFVKHDLETGESWELNLPEGRYASEAPFAPRIGAKDEDDGYLVSFIIDENTADLRMHPDRLQELRGGPGRAGSPCRTRSPAAPTASGRIANSSARAGSPA